MYHYQRTGEASRQCREAESAALEALRKGKIFMPTAEQTMFATLPYEKVTYKKLEGEEMRYYEPKKPLYAGATGATEIQVLGWLHEEEHPHGLLKKACPICGYQYGSGWQTIKVPEDVIDWLFSLPESKILPAWV